MKKFYFRVDIKDYEKTFCFSLDGQFTSIAGRILTYTILDVLTVRKDAICAYFINPRVYGELRRFLSDFVHFKPVSSDDVLVTVTDNDGLVVYRTCFSY